MTKNKGWKGEPHKHSCAAKGIKTKAIVEKIKTKGRFCTYCGWPVILGDATTTGYIHNNCYYIQKMFKESKLLEQDIIRLQKLIKEQNEINREHMN